MKNEKKNTMKIQDSKEHRKYIGRMSKRYVDVTPQQCGFASRVAVRALSRRGSPLSEA
jgi:hypothetical protein